MIIFEIISNKNWKYIKAKKKKSQNQRCLSETCHNQEAKYWSMWKEVLVSIFPKIMQLYWLMNLLLLFN